MKKFFQAKNKRRILLFFFMCLLISISPIIIVWITHRPVTTYHVRVSVFIAISIFYVFLCVKVPRFIVMKKKIAEFQFQAYGIAKELSFRTKCNYSEIKWRIDKSIEYCKPEKLKSDYNNDIRAAFFLDNVMRFVYLIALDYASMYDEQHYIYRCVKEYCSVMPHENEVMPISSCIGCPFWSVDASEAERGGFAFAVLTFVVLMVLFGK